MDESSIECAGRVQVCVTRVRAIRGVVVMKFAGIVGFIGPELPLLGALLAGCDAGEDFDNTKGLAGAAAIGGGGLAGEHAADGGKIEPTFSNVYATFTRGCACHVAGKG